MKMRKMLALGLASAMAVSLAACGGSASSSEAPAASEAAPAASEAASTAEAATSEAAPAADASTGDKEKLTIALRGGTYAAVVEACLPAFEADNNCEIEFLELEGDDLHSKLALDSVNPEGAYDLAMVGSSWVAEFLENDMVANLEAGEGALATIWPGWYSPTADGNCGYIVSPSKLTKDGPEVNTSVLGEWEIAIPANSTHKELAVKLLTYLMDPEVQAGTVELGGVPCRYSALTSPEALAAHPEFEVVAGALDTGWSRPVISQWSDFCDILGTEVDNIIQGMDDMDQGLAQAQSDLEALMAE